MKRMTRFDKESLFCVEISAQLSELMKARDSKLIEELASFPEERKRNSRKRTHKRKNGKNSNTEKQTDHQTISPNSSATPDIKENLAKKPEAENISQKQKR